MLRIWLLAWINCGLNHKDTKVIKSDFELQIVISSLVVFVLLILLRGLGSLYVLCAFVALWFRLSFFVS